MAEVNKYLQWLAYRSAVASARIDAMAPITPQSTPLLDLLARKKPAVKNG